MQTESTASLVAGLVLVVVFVSLSQYCGIGGGPVITLLLQTFFAMTTKTSIRYTYIVLFAGGIAGTIQNVSKRDKDDFPVINYDLALLTLPPIIGGSVVGVYLNNLLPDLAIVVLMAFFLTFVAVKTYRKITASKEPTTPLLDSKGTVSLQLINPKLIGLLQEEKESMPLSKIKNMTYMMVLTVLLLLARGSSHTQSAFGLSYCGFGYWVVNLVLFGIVYLLTKSFSIQIVERKNELHNYGLEPREISIPLQTTVLVGLAAGCLGSTLGLGGGLILLPVWISCSIPPTIAAATSSFLIVWNAASSIAQGLFEGSYQSHLFLVLLGTSIIFPLVGLKVLDVIFKNNANGMLKVLLSVLVISIVVLTFQSLVKFVSNPIAFMEWGAVC